MLVGWGRRTTRYVFIVFRSAPNNRSRWKSLEPAGTTSVGGIRWIQTSAKLTANNTCNRSSIEKWGFWSLLKWLGVSNCRIVRFRRKLMRFTYPWLAYSIPAALILGMGDFLAQYHLKPHLPQMTFGCFVRRCWERERTLVYALLGLLLVGPVLSKWNLFWYRKLRCKKGYYLLYKTLLDLFVLSPILLALMAVIYDQKYNNVFKDDWEKTKKNISEKYIPAVAEVMLFNIMTRPFVAMISCYLIPAHLRRSFRVLYELVFAAFLTDAFMRHELREPPPEPPPPPPPVQSTCPNLSKSPWKWPC